MPKKGKNSGRFSPEKKLRLKWIFVCVCVCEGTFVRQSQNKSVKIMNIQNSDFSSCCFKLIFKV